MSPRSVSALFSYSPQMMLSLYELTCANQGSFVRGGSTLTTFFFLFVWSMSEGGSKYHLTRAILGPLAKRHINGVSRAWRRWPNIECWLGSFVIFQGIWTSIAKKPYIFVIFHGGGVRTPWPPPPHLDPPIIEKLDSNVIRTTLKLTIIKGADPECKNP